MLFKKLLFTPAFYISVIGLQIFPFALRAQEKLTIEEAVQRAIVNHPAIKAADFLVEQQRRLQSSSLNISNPELEYEKERSSTYGLGIRQSFSFPTVYSAQSRLQKEKTRLAEAQKNITINDLRRSVRESYIQTQYLGALVAEYKVQDSTYQRYSNAAKRQFDAGQIDYLQTTFAEAKASEIRNMYEKAQIDHQYALKSLSVLIGLPDKPEIIYLSKLPAVDLIDTTSVPNPTINYYRQQTQVELRNLKLERNKVFPDLFIGYQKNSPFDKDSFSRFRAGLTIPLWFWQYRGNIKAANAGYKAAEQLKIAQKVTINSELQQASGSVNSNFKQVEYYEKTGLEQAKTIVNTASRLFTSGQNDYVNFIRNLADAYAIRLRYLEALRDYNNSVTNLNSLIGR